MPHSQVIRQCVSYLETVTDREKPDKTHETVAINGQISLKVETKQIELIYSEPESFGGKAEKKMTEIKD